MLPRPSRDKQERDGRREGERGRDRTPCPFRCNRRPPWLPPHKRRCSGGSLARVFDVRLRVGGGAKTGGQRKGRPRGRTKEGRRSSHPEPSTLRNTNLERTITGKILGFFHFTDFTSKYPFFPTSTSSNFFMV